VPEHSGTSHALAVGSYVAAIVLIFGAILVLYGLLEPTGQLRKSLGINANLWWGLFMVAFGVVVLALSWFSPLRRAAAEEARRQNGG
jgi:hypothetical protein